MNSQTIYNNNCDFFTKKHTLKEFKNLKFNQLKSFDEALQYINKTGLIAIDKSFPGYIPQWQKVACNLIDTIEKFYNTKFPLKDGLYIIPLKVKFLRSKDILIVKNDELNQVLIIDLIKNRIVIISD